MLKKFAVRNYKNFKDEISIDFENIAGYQFSTDCITDGLISKMLIYGQNATGKTNLGKAVMDIADTMLSDLGYMDNGIFFNADSMEDSALFIYEFQFGDKELIYKYARFSNQKLQKEELIIDGITIFKCDFSAKKYDFDNLKYVDAETVNVERYLQSLEVEDEAEELMETSLPFLKWLILNAALKNDSVLLQLSHYVKHMIMLTAGNAMRLYQGMLSRTFYKSLEKPEKLQDLEDFLNAMGIECKLVMKKLPDGQLELYFEHEKLIPFYENASSGTIALIDLYRRLLGRIKDAAFVYLDEFDAFYHYEMSENVIKYLKKRYPKCQIIMTSHNTNLMTNKLMRPDCLFILSKMGTLTALCDAAERELREGHNLEKMYISGEFERYK